MPDCRNRTAKVSRKPLPNTVEASEHLASRAVRAARVRLAPARPARYEAGPLVALLALPPDALVGAGDHVGRPQVAVALLAPLPRDLGMCRPRVVLAFQHLAVAAVGVERLHRNGRRMTPPRSRDRRAPQKGRGLVDVRAHDREAGRGCARAGGRRGEPARRLQPRLPRRPGFPARFPGVPALPRVPWDRPIHVAAGQPVGQRARGILLQDARARAGERQGPQDEGGEAKQDVFESSSPAATGRGCTHRSAITPRAT